MGDGLPLLLASQRQLCNNKSWVGGVPAFPTHTQVLHSEMAVALANFPAASVRSLQQCVVGHASGRSRFLLLRASQSQPWRCGGECGRNLGGSIVGSRLQRFSIVASSMGSSTPSQTMPNEKVDEESKWWEQIQTHQKSAARLSKVEEARTLLAASSTATLSTISQKYDGFPLGSMVLHATDDTGRPILAISSLSPHTKDLETNPKCSLLVSRDASDISDTVVTIIGEAETVSDAEWEGVRAVYLKKHPDAFWCVPIGRFEIITDQPYCQRTLSFIAPELLVRGVTRPRLVRITPKKIRFLAGSATAFVTFGELDGEEYLAAAVDPIAQFTSPIAGHMNRDHADQTKDIAEISLGVKIDYAKILQVDRLGFNIQTAHNGNPVKLRIPFPRPALDRKDVKNLIVEMLQGPAAATTP